MLIHEKAPFVRGCLLMISFLALFVLLLTPLFDDGKGQKLTGLQYADSVFNELSKGSSYFIPGVRAQIASLKDMEADLTVSLKKPELAPLALTLLQTAGVGTATAEGGKISFKGNLGAILTSATDDADNLYHNQGEPVSQKYGGVPALQAASAWWYLLSPCIKELQKQGHISQAQVVDQVIRRAVEPGNNFYSVPASKVSDHIWLMSGMLIFYVLYTLWYGFAIFELFEGVGLAMTKSASKQES
ncbi:MAG: hypothetical protein Q4F27_01610 [Desulfovibrionaceae bacterium]|nr:hypothetical protein [Desulfovibrionaceae bacterium]